MNLLKKIVENIYPKRLQKFIKSKQGKQRFINLRQYQVLLPKDEGLHRFNSKVSTGLRINVLKDNMRMERQTA